MKDYGYALGSSSGRYKFGASWASLVEWMKDRASRGSIFFVYDSKEPSGKRPAENDEDLLKAAKVMSRVISKVGSSSLSPRQAGYTRAMTDWYVPNKTTLDGLYGRLRSAMNLKFAENLKKQKKK
jgi:hypothetical protein